jgi:uncharacterized protein (TIGR03382 family)
MQRPDHAPHAQTRNRPPRPGLPRLGLILGIVLAALLLAAALWLLAPREAAAAPILPGGQHPALDAHMARQERQFYAFNAYPFGLSLNVHVKDMAARDLITNFLAQDAEPDFATFAGAHLHDLISMYGEYGDLGFFGGVALAGTAFRYLTMVREGADADTLADARAKVFRAARSWHVFKAIPGGGGVVARGIIRLVPEDPEDPPIPLPGYNPVPLFDGDGNPLPQPKDNGTRRDDNSDGVLPEGTWGWIDSASKDQLSGQVFGMVVLHEALSAIAGDTTLDAAERAEANRLIEEIAADAVAIGGMLMAKRQILGMEGPAGEGEYDLIIMDADGRPTMYHDLNPLSIEKIYLPEDASGFNVFNVFMAIGVLKGLLHVSGDPAIEEFLYRDFLGERGYLAKAADTRGEDAVNYLYVGTLTNTDVPDMTAVVLFITLFTENDPEVAAVVRDFFEHQWWDPDWETRFSASRSKMPLWHAIYLAMTDRDDTAALAGDLKDLLLAFPLGPYWEDGRVNCDDDEIAAGVCTAIDGVTQIVLDGQDADGRPLATEALDPSIRPNSDFNARSNPFRVNGNGNPTKLCPGGDLLAAYWMARYFEAGEGDDANRSMNVRDHMPVGGPTTPEPVPDNAGDEGPATDVIEPPDVVIQVDPGAFDPGTGETIQSDATDPDTTAPDAGGGPIKTSGGCAATGGTAGTTAPLMLALAMLAMLGSRRMRWTRQSTR